MSNDKAIRLYKLTYVLVLTFAVAAAFVFTIRAFLIDIFLAAVFAALLFPVYEKSLPLFGRRQALAATMIVIAALLAIALPLAGIFAMVTSEAVRLSEGSVTWIEQAVSHPERARDLLPKEIANAHWFQQGMDSAVAHAGDIVGAVSGFLTRSLSVATRGAVGFLLDLFVIAFAVLYFLQQGRDLVEHLMERIPLAKPEARAIVDRTLQITAASLKSIVLVGTVQGALVGAGFAVAGIEEPWFWGTVAAVASTVPGLGSGLVWAPGAIYLALNGHLVAGIGLAIWGLAVVSLADNVLRLFIIGRSVAIPSFVVFISTIGGLGAFGPAGLLIGPVLAGTLIGMLDLYQAVLKSSGLLASEDRPLGE